LARARACLENFYLRLPENIWATRPKNEGFHCSTWKYSSLRALPRRLISATRSFGNSNFAVSSSLRSACIVQSSSVFNTGSQFQDCDGAKYGPTVTHGGQWVTVCK
ncbi:MAG: hypothetical protein ABI885_27900, partial [Gammaproteobacteria bacterium]